MGLRACLGELPPDYEVVEAGRGVVAIDRRFTQALTDAGLSPAVVVDCSHGNS